MPWDRVHDEAEVLEHYISEELEERIATALGDPTAIPTATRSRPRPRDLDAQGGPAGRAGARAEGSSAASPTPTRDAPLPRRARDPARRRDRGPERQPFGGPLLVEVGGRGALDRRRAGRAYADHVKLGIGIAAALALAVVAFLGLAIGPLRPTRRARFGRRGGRGRSRATVPSWTSGSRRRAST